MHNESLRNYNVIDRSLSAVIGYQQFLPVIQQIACLFWLDWNAWISGVQAANFIPVGVLNSSCIIFDS